MEPLLTLNVDYSYDCLLRLVLVDHDLLISRLYLLGIGQQYFPTISSKVRCGNTNIILTITLTLSLIIASCPNRLLADTVYIVHQCTARIDNSLVCIFKIEKPVKKV